MSQYGDSFKELLNLHIGGKQEIPSDWICKNTQLRKKPYSFTDHEYQISFINDKHRIVAAKKCAQIGFTEVLLRWMLCFLIQHQGSQTIFTQPTDTDVGKFAKSRVDILFEECSIIKKLGTGGIDSAYLKRVGQSFLNLRGTFGTKAAISVPSDANVYDEIDFSNPRVLSQFKSRLQHSKYKMERLISTPTLPNFGISALYNQSDQKRVILKCQHCNEYQFLEWEDNVWIRDEHGVGAPRLEYIEQYIQEPWKFKPYIVCNKCHQEVDRNWAAGHREWIAEYPDRASDLDNGISGYQISQLDVSFVDASDIVKASDKRFPEGFEKEQDFYNFVLGKEYSGGDGSIVDASVRDKVSIRMDTPATASGTFLGIDLGGTCNIVIIKDYYMPAPMPTVITAFTCTADELENLPEILTKYGVLYSVSDAQPFTTTVTKIAKQENLKTRFKICYFGGKREYSVNGIQVTANRTQMLDMATEGLIKNELAVADSVPDLFWDHCKNLVKIKEEDNNGAVFYTYPKIGPDHYGLALGYALLAKKLFHEVPPEITGSSAPIGISGHRTNI